MNTIGRSTAPLAIAVATTINLSACYTSGLNPDAVQRADAALQEQDQGVYSTPQ